MIFLQHCWLGHQLNQRLNLQKDTPYLALTVELWDVFNEALGENGPGYNGTELYMI